MESSSLKDDTVLYNIYPIIASSDSLSTLAILYNKEIQRLSRSHIWYYESMTLSEKTGRGTDVNVQCLTGTTCFRECVDDEWFIVDVLLQLTKLHPHLIISIEDNDGQFLLIETANVIPRWLKPDTATNRVFLYQGAVHIIGSPTMPSDLGVVPAGTPTIQQAIRCIRTVPAKTIASNDVQKVIRKRLETCRVPLHSAHCLIPIPAAHILNTHKQLISAVVHTFCDRDKEEMKVVSQLKDFSPKTHEMIVSTVTFPRLLYAKLSHQQWSIPTPYSSDSVSSHQYKTALLGMKLTYGLEILSRCYSKHGPRSSDEKGWNKFVSSLSEKGYFKGELEGSKLYKELLSDAKDYYNNTIQNDEMRDLMNEAGCFISEQLQLKEWEDHKYELDTPPPPADDESWLTMTQDDLDSMLNAHNTHSDNSVPQPKSYSTSHASSLELEEVAYGMKSFVDQVSSVDGAEFPWSSETASSGGEVKLDPNSFMSTLQSLIDKLDNTSHDEGSDDEGSDDESETSSVDEECDEEMLKVMDQLNQELSTFTNLNHRHGDEGVSTSDQEPLDIDYDVVANLLESYSGQEGGAGPASNIMNSLGIKFPQQT